MKKFWIAGAGALVVVVVGLAIVMGPGIARFMQVTTVNVDPDMKIFLGGGGNSVVLKSPDKRQVLIVDTKMPNTVKPLKRYVDSLGPDVQVTIINTHYHRDHTGGNEAFPRATVIAGDYSEEFWNQEVQSGRDERVLQGVERELVIGPETVKILNIGQAHTTHDMVVYFVNRKLLVTGDLLFHEIHPVLFQKSGADTAKWEQALGDLGQTFDAVTVVPGHGSITNQAGLAAARDYFASIRAAVGDPDKLEALRQQYSRYVSRPISGFDNTVRFIEAEHKRASNP